MLILLSVLATLQYRWLNRVSLGEQKLMQTNLEVKTRGFCGEFDREITRAYSNFKLNSQTPLGENLNNLYAERFDKWVKTSPHPQLVKNIFLSKAVDDGETFNLQRFNEMTREFEQVEWTTELGNLRERFERKNTSDSKGINPFIGGANSIVEEIPALINTIPAVKLTDKKTDRKEIDWQHPLGYVVIMLDIDYIKQKFLPTLAETYFLSSDNFDYDLNITSRSKPEEIIYQTNPQSKTSNNSTADANCKLFNISFDQVQSFSAEQIYETRKKSSDQEKSDFTLVIPEVKNSEPAADNVLLIDDAGRWSLKVTHQSGSLDAAVANARRWNLLTSFGILLLLAASIAVIIILSRRSARFGRKQMEFVAGVSHEFRTPLAVIYSLSENLAAGRIKTAEQVRNYGATIHKDVRRLTEMVEQVLEFAGVERSGKNFYDLIPLDVGKLVGQIADEHIILLQNDGWSIKKEIESDLPLIPADEAALTRAIQNLISNAIKYCNDNRWLKIRVYKNRSFHREEVCIAVEDKGSGIDQVDLPHIFEPFYRGRKAADTQISGCGLGLNLVKQITKAHGGKVTVESSYGVGSRFILHLPVSVSN